jgi:hypothetical protein
MQPFVTGNGICFLQSANIMYMKMFCTFGKRIISMTEIIIEKKKYVLIPEKEYKALQKKAALKVRSEKTLSVEEARAYSRKLINKWASEK